MIGSLKKLLPAFIPLVMDVMSHVKRDASHNNNIKKIDKTEEKLATIENLVVRLEKKVITNRDEIKTMSLKLQIWLVLNSAMLIAIVVKLFFLQ